jgi:hypothetical protein
MAAKSAEQQAAYDAVRKRLESAAYRCQAFVVAIVDDRPAPIEVLAQVA